MTQTDQYSVGPDWAWVRSPGGGADAAGGGRFLSWDEQTGLGDPRRPEGAQAALRVGALEGVPPACSHLPYIDVRDRQPR